MWHTVRVVEILCLMAKKILGVFCEENDIHDEPTREKQYTFMNTEKLYLVSKVSL